MSDRSEEAGQPATCVIFDCDGTLVDSELLCNVALAESLAGLGIEESPRDLMTAYRGGKLARIFEDIEKRHAVNLPFGFENSYRSRVAALFEQELQPVAGVKEVLEWLQTPRCVASSAPRDKIRRALRVTGLERFFAEKIFSSYEVNSWKPEPGLFLHAATEMGVAPESCVVVEDSALGAQAAAKAGMKCYLYDASESLAGSDIAGATVFRDMLSLPALLAPTTTFRSGS